MIKLLYSVLFFSWSFALTGEELAVKMDQRSKPEDSKVNLTMVLTNKKGKTRTSEIRSISKDGGKKQISWFLAPADDKGVGFLKIEHDDRDDEMRMWLPAFKKVRRISSKKKSDSFMGSDMSYEDMASRQIDEYNFAILGNEPIDEISCQLLESKPRESIRSEYSRHLSWVDPERLVILQEESFDKTGALLKEKFYSYMQIKNYTILTEIQVTNVQKNHSTRLSFANIELDTNVEDKLFQEKNLKRIPK